MANKYVWVRIINRKAVCITDGGMYARALYPYEATAEEELTFQEGQLIKIVRKEINGIDDGWWEGEINGKSGVFPSLVVEEINPTSGQVGQGHWSAGQGHDLSSLISVFGYTLDSYFDKLDLNLFALEFYSRMIGLCTYFV